MSMWSPMQYDGARSTHDSQFETLPVEAGMQFVVDHNDHTRTQGSGGRRHDAAIVARPPLIRPIQRRRLHGSGHARRGEYEVQLPRGRCWGLAVGVVGGHIAAVLGQFVGPRIGLPADEWQAEALHPLEHRCVAGGGVGIAVFAVAV